MDLNLDGKVALVTGANKGLGAAAAEALAGEGARLYLTARDATRLEAKSVAIEDAHGVEIAYGVADLTQPGAADSIAAAAVERFGQLDVLVNCAGASQGGLFWEIPDATWEESLALKFMGTVRMMRAVLPAMRAAGYGRIVTVVGNTGKQPSPRMLPGAAANAALLSVISGLAQQVAGDGVVVLAVNPGPTRTERWNGLMAGLAEQDGTSVEKVEARFMEQIPMNRLGAPEEIGRLIAFLASDAAANMTGTSVTADGGWTKAIA